MKKITIAAALCLMSVCTFAQKWTSLFNGKDLQGWKQVTGTAVYKVEDGCIVGEQVSKGNLNSFLATEQNYSDFILEFEFKLAEDMNSGVQFRSAQDFADEGRVYGYQFELDDRENRCWTGGIYEESRRGWLYPLEFNKTAKTAAKPIGEWNKGRLEVCGDHIKTFVNGVQCADLYVDAFNDGFIALQVHGTKSGSNIGTKTYWKNIRICTKNVGKYMTKDNPAVYSRNYLTNRLTPAQEADGWKLLWDGETLNGWMNEQTGVPPTQGWTVRDGSLIVNEFPDQRGRSIMTVNEYTNFILSVDFKLTEGANSGIKYFVRPNQYKDIEIGCEFQLLDDERHPDAKCGVNGDRTLASLYDMITADKTGVYYDIKKWNTAVIKVQGNHVEHWLNGVKVVEYERNTQMFNALVAYSKYRKFDNFGNWESGHILLQDHSDKVYYRNIMIKEL